MADSSSPSDAVALEPCSLPGTFGRLGEARLVRYLSSSLFFFFLRDGFKAVRKRKFLFYFTCCDFL